ncbi:MAG: hypothetical protein VB078_02245 [Clostridiaceae bacterium]|nr:hypothetical protein [Clostridiaceae bacterium]
MKKKPIYLLFIAMFSISLIYILIYELYLRSAAALSFDAMPGIIYHFAAKPCLYFSFLAIPAQFVNTSALQIKNAKSKAILYICAFLILALMAIAIAPFFVTVPDWIIKLFIITDGYPLLYSILGGAFSLSLRLSLLTKHQ